ncbi:MAG: ABC transporter ATP-binding protein [Candidatus Merdivicinus sp.]|jgi:ABC-2 type transport system ATP-binding protein
MPEKAVIMVRNVTMRFRRAKNEATSLKELLLRRLRREHQVEMFTALNHISFQIQRGEVIGVIGTNGSGKSTLLKIISGALIPTEGTVLVDRKKVQLLTLGTGFDPELTGRENVYLNGALIGYQKEWIDRHFDEIVRFAELEGFMEEKVRNYSSGMVSRLGFAIATAGDAPEILILDEVLSVGDLFFRKKSEARIREMIHSGSTVLIVSHSTPVIRQNCSRVIWIEKGQLRGIGDPQEICSRYEKMKEG